MAASTEIEELNTEHNKIYISPGSNMTHAENIFT